MTATRVIAILKKTLPILIFLLFIFIFFLRPIGGDGDIYHHLYTGRDVLKTYSIPSIDTYTFTADGRYWIANAWGMGVVFYVLYITLGGIGLSVFVSLTAVLLFYLLYKLVRSIGVEAIPALLTLTIGAAVIGIRWPNRPEIIMYPFVVLLLLIDRYQEKKPRLVLLYPLIFFIWANLYGASVLAGFGLLGIFLIRRVISNHKRFLHIQKAFLLSVIASFVLALFNGNGVNTIFYAYGIREINQVQGEWQGILNILAEPSVNMLLIDQYQISVYLMYLVLCIILACLFYKIVNKHHFLFFLWLMLLGPFLYIRQTSLAVVLSLPLLAILVQACIHKWKKCTFIMLTALAIASVGIIWWTSPHGAGMERIKFSTDIISFFKEYDLTGNAYVDQDLGSFLSFYLYPDVKVYSDTRDDLFLPTNVLKDNQNVILDGKDIFYIIDKYHPSIVVADLGSSASYRSLLYSRSWALVFYDGNTAIFIPVSVAKAKHMEIFSAIEPYVQNAAKPNMLDKATGEYSKLLLNNTSEYVLQVKLQLVRTLIADNQYNKAIAIAEKIHANQGPLTTLFDAARNKLLVTAFFGLNDCVGAKNYLTKYDNAVSNKFLFDWERRIPSDVSLDYVIYYIQCEQDQNAFLHYYQNFIKDKYKSSSVDEAQLNSLIYQKYGNIVLPFE